MREPPRKRLSDVVKALPLPHKRKRFITEFRRAVMEGIFSASLTSEEFRYEGVSRRRGDQPEQIFTETAHEMIFEETGAYHEWYARNAKTFEVKTNQRAKQPTAQQLLDGTVDFESSAEQTRARLAALYARGHRLGTTDKKAQDTTTGTTRSTNS